MPVESATFIADLNSSNPVGATDPKSQGDDHLRLIKNCLLNTIPLAGLVTASHAELNILDGVTLTAAQINDAALKSAANTFTNNQTLAAAGSVNLALSDTAAGLNQKIWRFISQAGQAFIAASFTDAGAFVESPITVTKNTAGEITALALAGDAITLNGIALTDFARLSQENVITGATQTLSAARPSLRFTETDAAVNAGKWNIEAQTGVFLLETLSDLGASGTQLIQAVRTGNTASLALGGTAITLNGVNVTDYARLSQANTFTASQFISAAGGVTLKMLQSDAGSDEKVWDMGAFGGGVFHMRALNDAQSVGVDFMTVNRTGTTVDEVALVATGLAFTGALVTPNTTASEVGFKGAPQSNVTGSPYTLVLSDAGKTVRLTSGTGVTIPDDASVVFPTATIIRIHNRSGGSITVTKTTASGLLLNGVPGTTGARTLPNNSICEIEKSQGDEWIISGPVS